MFTPSESERRCVSERKKGKVDFVGSRLLSSSRVTSVIRKCLAGESEGRHRRDGNSGGSERLSPHGFTVLGWDAVDGLKNREGLVAPWFLHY